MKRYPFQRVFLDTNVVHYLATLPSFFFESAADDQDSAKLTRLRSSTLLTDIHVLRALPDMLQRGVPHELVITPDVIQELRLNVRTFGRQLLDWCREMGWIEEYVPRTFFDGVADVLDPMDRCLYLQAVTLGCDAFLTTDYGTIVNRRGRLPPLGTRVVTPSEWWDEMRPWAGLFL